MSVVKKEMSVSEDLTFVPLNDFELVEVGKLIALEIAYVNNQWFGEEYVFMQRDILLKSSRFDQVSRRRKSKVDGNVKKIYLGYAEAGDFLNYVRCNNGMYLYFNDKAELIARSN